MCGIAGFVACTRFDQTAERVLDTMLDSIAHRGPDGRGARVDRDANVALGHVRLAINDLSDRGEQPIVSSDGGCALVVSGEVYGFRSTRTALVAEGETFSSKSDSELVLALYRRHGLDFVHRLRGEFALALFDRERDRLVLARDRFGVRPLHFHTDGERLLWASEAKALLAHPSVPRLLCPRAAVNQLVQVMVPGTTAFEGVEAVQPGCMVVVERSGGGLDVKRHRYWDLDFPERDGYPEASEEELVEQVRAAVVESLVLRTEADVPVGVYLSGGMDSGGILGLAAAATQHPPRAVTLAFTDDAYDESAIAAEVARHHGVELHVRTIEDEDVYGDDFVRAVWHSERTFYNTLGITKMHLSAFARARGLRAVLSGEGADELFAGYPSFAVDHASESGGTAEGGASDALFRGAILAATPQRHPVFEDVCGFTPAWVQPWISTWQRVRPLLSGEVRAEVGDHDPLGAVAHALDPDRLAGRRRLDIAQYSWVKTMLDGQILSWGGDRVDMANAVESRPVLLDHHVAEAATRVPPESRIRDGREKWLLREALRHVLPPVLYQRRKFAFMSPPAYRSAARAAHLDRLIDRFLTPRRLKEVGVCDPGRTADFLAEARVVRDPAAANEIDKVCNHLLGLHILHDQFIR